MRVRLLKNIMENGGVKIVRRRRQADGTFVVEVPFVKGAVIEMSDASGRKYIDRKDAEEFVDQPSSEEQPK